MTSLLEPVHNVIQHILKAYFQTHTLVEHQLGSYNYFIETQLPQILIELSNLKVKCYIGEAKHVLEHHIKIKNWSIDKPVNELNEKMYPQEARLRSLTYESKLFLDLTHSIYFSESDNPPRKVHEQAHDHVLFCTLPVMVKSCLCNLSGVIDVPNYNHRNTNGKSSSTKHNVTQSIEQIKKEMCDELYHGGYFIVKGQEKTVLTQERLRYMHPCITAVPKSNRFSKYSHVSELRSCNESKLKASSTVKMFSTKAEKGSSSFIFVEIPFLKNSTLPLTYLFRLLGCTNSQDMFDYIIGEEDPIDPGNKTKLQHQKQYHAVVRNICMHSASRSKANSETETSWIDPADIYASLVSKKDKEGRHIDYLVKHEVLPQIGVTDSETISHLKKIRLGAVARELILISSTLKYIPVHDREHAIHKRFETCGLLIGLMMRQLVIAELKQINMFIFKLSKKNEALKKTNVFMDEKDETNYIYKNQYLDIASIFYRFGISEGLRYALATGNWGKNKGASNSQQGVSQPLNRTSPMATFSHLRRTSIPINRDGKSAEPRQLHTSRWGETCPVDSPEGHSCGLIHNLSLFCHITNGIPQDLLCRVIDSIELANWNRIEKTSNREADETKGQKILVFVNGSPKYWTTLAHVDENCNKLKEARLAAILPWEVSIYKHTFFLTTILHINCHIGNRLRPVFCVSKLCDLVLAVYQKTNTCGSFGMSVPDMIRRHLQCSKRCNSMSDHEATFIWNYLLTSGTIVYMDKNEEAAYQIAVDARKVPALSADNEFGYYFGSGGNAKQNEKNETKSKIAMDLLGRPDINYRLPEKDEKESSGSNNRGAMYLEIIPWGILGIMASLIPFIEKDQTVRAIFQCSHGKAAIGISNFGFQRSFHAIQHMLWYPQSPIVTTNADTMLHLTSLPTAQNAIVAIMPDSGNNVDDAITISQSAIDRGLFRSSLFHTYPFEDNKNDTLRFGRAPLQPDEKTNLDIDGLPRSYEPMRYGDKIFEQVDPIASVSTATTSNTNTSTNSGTIPPMVKPRTKSLTYKGKGAHIHLAQAHSVKEIVDKNTTKTKEALRKEKVKSMLVKGTNTIDFDTNEAASRVDTIMVTNPKVGETAGCGENTDERRSVLVRMHITRTPQIGDKFSSRHGQKGVCAATYTQEDLPFTREGIVPDMIVNPHMLPSRMTVGDLFERILGKKSCLDGTIGDGTAFQNTTIPEHMSQVEKIERELESRGYSKSGKEVMYSGHTGKRIEATIFMGVINYQRLTHQSADKVHARSTGPNEAITRQATCRRSKNGGQRFGEMERDCMISHGAMAFTKDRLMDCADSSAVSVCKKCGDILGGLFQDPFENKNDRYTHYQNESTDKNTGVFCNTCQLAESRSVALPYAFVTLMNELKAMGILPKLNL